MTEYKTRHTEKLKTRFVRIYIFAFLAIMFAISWFLLPGFKMLFSSDYSIFNLEVFPEYKPTPVPTVIKEPEVKEIADAIATVMPSPTPIIGFIADDNSYKSNNVEITIEKVVRENLTYYAADVKITDMSLIKSGLFRKLGNDISRKKASEIANKNNAVFAINTDFYTYKDRGLIIRNGKIMLDNGFRDILCIFADGSMDCFGPYEYEPDELLEMGVVETFDFGPIMVYDGKVTEASIGGITQKTAKHPRTGVGYYSEGHYLFIVADGRKEGYSLGINIEDFAQLFESYGVELAYNLDGGGSSTMVFMGELVNLPEGNDHQRSIDSILYIGDTEYTYEEIEE